jgi:hypothetical protein
MRSFSFSLLKNFAKTARRGGIDLGIQTDGLQEMTTQSIDNHMSRFSYSENFYSKNVVAKYLPTHAGIDQSDGTLPLNRGRSLQIIDTLNLDEVQLCYETHIQSYTPANHELISSTPSRTFPHYLHFLSSRLVS